jgi:hypothetical protein
MERDRVLGHSEKIEILVRMSSEEVTNAFWGSTPIDTIAARGKEDASQDKLGLLQTILDARWIEASKAVKLQSLGATQGDALVQEARLGTFEEGLTRFVSLLGVHAPHNSTTAVLLDGVP